MKKLFIMLLVFCTGVISSILFLNYKTDSSTEPRADVEEKNIEVQVSLHSDYSKEVEDFSHEIRILRNIEDCLAQQKESLRTRISLFRQSHALELTKRDDEKLQKLAEDLKPTPSEPSSLKKQSYRNLRHIILNLQHLGTRNKSQKSVYEAQRLIASAERRRHRAQCPNAHKKAYSTCRNWQFAHKIHLYAKISLM